MKLFKVKCKRPRNRKLGERQGQVWFFVVMAEDTTDALREAQRVHPPGDKDVWTATGYSSKVINYAHYRE